MTGHGDLRVVLRQHYGVSNPDLRQIPHSWEGNTFHQPRPGSAGWVVRVIPGDRAISDAEALSFLEQAGYPAPRLIRTVHGATMVPCGSGSVLVTTFIPGSPADLSPMALYVLGKRLGHLHSLTLPATRELSPAGMLPATDMTTARGWLRAIVSLPTPELAETYKQLVSAIQRIEPGEDLPRTLIHNDAHPGNAIDTAEGAPIFIDWSGAGLGPPMVDLGFLLISSEVAISWATPIPPAAGRVEAIVDGYACYRLPTPAELDWLPDAIRFRGLLYGAAHLADSVARGRRQITETWWWDRYLAADDLAIRARRRFRQHG